MSCAFEKELLTGYYDGELDAAEKAQVERHIAGCSECLRELGEIRSTSQLVRALARPGIPRQASEGIWRALEGERWARLRDRRRRRLLWSAAAAAGIFLALNVAYFLSVERKGRPEDWAPAIGFVSAPEANKKSESAAREREEELLREPPPLKGPLDGRALVPSRSAEGEKAPPPAPSPPKAALNAPPSRQEGELQSLLEKEKARTAAAPEAPKPEADADREVAQAGRAAAAPVEWTVRAADVKRARERVEEVLRKGGALPPEAAARRKEAAGPIAAEVTAEQLDRIRNELRGEPGIVFLPVAPEELRAFRRAAVESRRQADASAGVLGKAPGAPGPVRVRLIVHILPAAPDVK
jgi:hypothetical protein